MSLSITDNVRKTCDHATRLLNIISANIFDHFSGSDLNIYYLTQVTENWSLMKKQMTAEYQISVIIKTISSAYWIQLLKQDKVCLLQDMA